MSIAVPVFLTLVYAAFAPLGRRVRAAENRVLNAVLPEVPSAPAVSRVRGFLSRGWTSLLTSDLWLLLLLASCIAIFHTWLLAFVLPVAGVALRKLLDVANPYPARLAWYLDRFRAEVDKARTSAEAEGDEARLTLAAELIEALDDLMAREGDAPVP